MTAKVEMFPDERFIQEAMIDCRCRIEDVPMKSLGTPDTSYQARAEHLDMGHVERLAQIFDVEGTIGPVVVFRATSGRTILADGFHRHEMARRKGLPTIRAYVVECADSKLEYEARLFSTMCNRRLCLPRNKEDIRKAVEILFADPVCWKWSDSRIGKHCGLSYSTVTKYRVEFATREGLAIPEVKDGSDGITRNFKNNKSNQSTSINIRTYATGADRDRVEYRACFRGRQRYLGVDPGKARAKADAIVADAIARDKLSDPGDAPRAYVCESKYLAEFLTKNHLPFKNIKMNRLIYPHIRGCYGCGIVVVVSKFVDTDSVPWVLGCLQVLRELSDDPGARMVCLCDPAKGPKGSMEIARKFGVEFATPDEFVASIKETKS